MRLESAGFLVKPQVRGWGGARNQNSGLLVQGASIRPAQPRNNAVRPQGGCRNVLGEKGHPGRVPPAGFAGPSPLQVAPPGTCFPASSPRHGLLPVLSRPKQKHRQASTLLLGHALCRDSRLYTLFHRRPHLLSTRTPYLPCDPNPHPAVPDPHVDDRPHLRSLRLLRSFTNTAKLFAVTKVVIGQGRPRAASARPPQLALSDGS